MPSPRYRRISQYIKTRRPAQHDHHRCNAFESIVCCLARIFATYQVLRILYGYYKKTHSEPALEYGDQQTYKSHCTLKIIDYEDPIHSSSITSHSGCPSRARRVDSTPNSDCRFALGSSRVRVGECILPSVSYTNRDSQGEDCLGLCVFFYSCPFLL